MAALITRGLRRNSQCGPFPLLADWRVVRMNACMAASAQADKVVALVGLIGRSETIERDDVMNGKTVADLVSTTGAATALFAHDHQSNLFPPAPTWRVFAAAPIGRIRSAFVPLTVISETSGRTEAHMAVVFRAGSVDPRFYLSWPTAPVAVDNRWPDIGVVRAMSLLEPRRVAVGWLSCGIQPHDVCCSGTAPRTVALSVEQARLDEHGCVAGGAVFQLSRVSHRTNYTASRNERDS